MQTSFTLAQLADPDVAAADPILRACVHCGFCTATCPTYVLLGDELDGPRGRIYLMKNNLESGAPPDAELVTHIDRCLSCYACMTTCPSGVNYMHLVDPMRHRIEQNYRRPPLDRALRAVLNWTLAASDAVPLGAAGGARRENAAARSPRPARRDAAPGAGACAAPDAAGAAAILCGAG